MKVLLTFVFLIMSLTVFTTPAFASCTDGRIACSHKCADGTRPACTDSRGAEGKAYCTTARFCHDSKPQKKSAKANCEKGWQSSDTKCSKADRRRRGCQDKQGAYNGYCLRMTS